MDVYQHVKISYVIRFHQNENLLRFSRRRRLDDVFTTSHMRRTLARENFTSARRRRAISLSMLKVPIESSTDVDVDDIDLEISSFWLQEAYIRYMVSEIVWRTKKSRSLNSNNIIDIIPMSPTK